MAADGGNTYSLSLSLSRSALENPPFYFIDSLPPRESQPESGQKERQRRGERGNERNIYHRDLRISHSLHANLFKGHGKSMHGKSEHLSLGRHHISVDSAASVAAAVTNICQLLLRLLRVDLHGPFENVTIVLSSVLLSFSPLSFSPLFSV